MIIIEKTDEITKEIIALFSKHKVSASEGLNVSANLIMMALLKFGIEFEQSEQALENMLVTLGVMNASPLAGGEAKNDR